MSVVDYSGQWVGEFLGTNFGSVFVELEQNESSISGKIRASEPIYGQYEYNVFGVIADIIRLTLTVSKNPSNIGLDKIIASVLPQEDGSLLGNFESVNGAKGIFKLVRPFVHDVDIEGDDLDSSITESNENIEINKIYSTSSIKVEKGFYTAYELKRKFDKKPSLVILDSDFQRKSVWTLQQKRELIESVLMGLPLPIFYFNEDKKGRLIVIDGRQRLSTLFEFMSDKNDKNEGQNPGFSLDKLKVLAKFNKHSFKDLDPILQTKIEDFQIVAHVIQPPTPDRIKFDIFDRVNRGGTQLNKQEIRNALYQGNATTLLYKLSQEKSFEVATEGVFLKDKRMKDRYMLLRFIAFYLYFAKKIQKEGNIYIYTADIDELLGLTMEYLNSITVAEVIELEQITIKALENTFFYLGEGAFRLLPKNGKKYPININIFENIMLAMTMLPEKDSLKTRAIVSSFNNMKESIEFKELIYNSRDSEGKVSARYEIIRDIVEDITFGEI